MVLGVYTVVSSLGLLVGLPYNTNSNIQAYDIELNNNFYNYVSNNNLTELNFSSNFCIIIEYNTNNYISDSISINLSNKLFNYDTFTFGYVNKIDKYAFYTFSEGSLDNNSSNYMSFSSPPSSSYPIYSINQCYIGYKTSALSSIGGDSIIGSITSGLGLMEDITKQFGSGFGSLIWDNSKNQLTTFGNFALIFLGVSITFSIVKLCMSLIRSKTGS